MKAVFLFLAPFVVCTAMGVLFMRNSHAAEPVDVFVPPVPVNPGTSATILPPGTYHAVTPDGVRLSGWIHTPDNSRFPSMSRPQPASPPRMRMLQRNPEWRFVPVKPEPRAPMQRRSPR